MIRPDTNIIRSCESRQLFSEESLSSRSFNLLLCEEGSLEIRTSAGILRAGIAAFYDTEEIRLIPDGPCRYTLIRLSPGKVLTLTGRKSLFLRPHDAFPTRSRLILSACIREMASSPEPGASIPQLLTSSLTFRILQILKENAEEETGLPEVRAALSEHREALFKKLTAYIRDHAYDGITLSGTAAAFGITPQYLGRFLKETAGCTFRDYLAAVTEENEALLSLFSENKRPERPAPGTPLSSVPAFPGPAPEHAGAASVRTVRAALDPVHAAPQYFRKLINLGYARNLRTLDLDSALEYVQDEIGFQCGRICRITDLIRSGSYNGKAYHDFSAVFSLLDPLISRGITPFLELGNKALLIQETTSVSYVPVSPTDTRKYYGELLKILPDFARACINHYGQSSFDSWYFEISFMYTSDEEREHFGLVQYAGVFRKIYQVLRSFSLKCRIGGPGFNDWSDKSRIRQMIRIMSTHGITPDFFSAYIYPMKSGDSGIMHLSEDPDEGIRRMRIFSETVREKHPDCEIWITEFNSNLSSRNYLNDSPYQAAYITRIMLGAFPLGIRAIGYYLLSDAPLRYLDSLDFLFGGWGLITDRGLPKPSFHAFRMMDMLGHYLIRVTDRFLITANSRGSFQVLLNAYQHPREDFLYKNVEKEDLTMPQLVFEEAVPARYHLVIGHVLRGTYIIKEYRISEQYADLFSAWRELDYLYPGSTSVLRDLKVKSELIPRLRVCRIEEGEPFEADVELSGTELRLITVDLYASHTRGDSL